MTIGRYCFYFFSWKGNNYNRKYQERVGEGREEKFRISKEKGFITQSYCVDPVMCETGNTIFKGGLCLLCFEVDSSLLQGPAVLRSAGLSQGIVGEKRLSAFVGLIPRPTGGRRSPRLTGGVGSPPLLVMGPKTGGGSPCCTFSFVKKPCRYH